MLSENNKEINRQAVVIIHGMGEQAPNETLRGFVNGMVAWIKNFDPYAEKPRYWNRPDSISEHYETRKITMEAYAGNVKTDFYEFYWAHHMRENTWPHLLAWFKKLATTWVTNIPPRLKWVWITIWVFIILTLSALWYIFTEKKQIMDWFEIFSQNNLNLFGGVVGMGIAVIAIRKYLLPLLFKGLKGTILNSAGDAARYLNPKTYNIEERSTIRREGINFLKKLHDRTEKKYDKIIVVGHSLGSVVAYDLVRLLWQEYHEKFSFSAKVDNNIFDSMAAVSSGEKKIDNIDVFQQLQEKCWLQYKTNGNKWLISDFITCAGAIAHCDYYITDGLKFEEKVAGKEIPVCPPVLEKGDKSLLFGSQEMEGVNEKGENVNNTVHFLNHAAVFAVTRWTNIFFSSDFVGSDAARIFRSGVKDIKVPRKGLWFLPGGHTNYWDARRDNLALEAIAKAIGFKQETLGENNGKNEKGS